MDEQFHANEYRTGRTQPQKSRSGLLAVLLICVIFLMGLVSVLSYMNIRLFHYLEQVTAQSKTSLSFSQADTALPADSNVDQRPYLVLDGMVLQELSAPYQQLYNLPDGLYISHVAKDSHAEQQGIVPGDVLISFAGTPISQLDALQNLYAAQPAGSHVEAVVYQNGRHWSLTLTLGKDE